MAAQKHHIFGAMDDDDDESFIAKQQFGERNIANVGLGYRLLFVQSVTLLRPITRRCVTLA